MADIQLQVKPQEKPEPQEGTLTFELDIRRTLDGNFIIRDHSDVDIVFYPTLGKITAFIKESLTDDIYYTQHKFFDFLAKKGVVDPSSIQGGNVFGSLEGKLIPSREADPVKMVLMVVAKFIEEEKPYFEYMEAYEKFQEDRLTEPDESESTDFDPSRHAQEKGSIRPMYIRSPYGINFAYMEE